MASIAVTRPYDTQSARVPAATAGIPEDVILTALERAALELSRRLGWDPERRA
ncbi:hypothetical protein ABIC98_000089 [Arthrobacter nitrophenolicus]|uniref:Uncharacterized protein n=1 Tax=Arthrobacter nitrophenolicus TaxID=683150 RepID=A0ACC6TAB0_9MICC